MPLFQPKTFLGRLAKKHWGPSFPIIYGRPGISWGGETYQISGSRSGSRGGSRYVPLSEVIRRRKAEQERLRKIAELKKSLVAIQIRKEFQEANALKMPVAEYRRIKARQLKTNSKANEEKLFKLAQKTLIEKREIEQGKRSKNKLKQLEAQRKELEHTQNVLLQRKAILERQAKSISSMKQYTQVLQKVHSFESDSEKFLETQKKFNEKVNQWNANQVKIQKEQARKAKMAIEQKEFSWGGLPQRIVQRAGETAVVAGGIGGAMGIRGGPSGFVVGAGLGAVTGAAAGALGETTKTVAFHGFTQAEKAGLIKEGKPFVSAQTSWKFSERTGFGSMGFTSPSLPPKTGKTIKWDVSVVVTKPKASRLAGSAFELVAMTGGSKALVPLRGLSQELSIKTPRWVKGTFNAEKFEFGLKTEKPLIFKRFYKLAGKKFVVGTEKQFLKNVRANVSLEKVGKEFAKSETKGVFQHDVSGKIAQRIEQELESTQARIHVSGKITTKTKMFKVFKKTRTTPFDSSESVVVHAKTVPQVVKGFERKMPFKYSEKKLQLVKTASRALKKEFLRPPRRYSIYKFESKSVKDFVRLKNVPKKTAEFETSAIKKTESLAQREKGLQLTGRMKANTLTKSGVIHSRIGFKLSEPKKMSFGKIIKAKKPIRTVPYDVYRELKKSIKAPSKKPITKLSSSSTTSSSVSGGQVLQQILKRKPVSFPTEFEESFIAPTKLIGKELSKSVQGSFTKFVSLSSIISKPITKTKSIQKIGHIQKTRSSFIPVIKFKPNLIIKPKEITSASIPKTKTIKVSQTKTISTPVFKSTHAVALKTQTISAIHSDIKLPNLVPPPTITTGSPYLPPLEFPKLKKEPVFLRKKKKKGKKPKHLIVPPFQSSALRKFLLSEHDLPNAQMFGQEVKFKGLLHSMPTLEEFNLRKKIKWRIK